MVTESQRVIEETSLSPSLVLPVLGNQLLCMDMQAHVPDHHHTQALVSLIGLCYSLMPLKNRSCPDLHDVHATLLDLMFYPVLPSSMIVSG